MHFSWSFRQRLRPVFPPRRKGSVIMDRVGHVFITRLKIRTLNKGEEPVILVLYS